MAQASKSVTTKITLILTMHLDHRGLTLFKESDDDLQGFILNKEQVDRLHDFLNKHH